MQRLLSKVLLTVSLLVPIAVTPTIALADDHFHDKGHNDDHTWNSHEDKAYRMWARDQHRKYVDFHKLNEADQESYWGWRHEHSDALLKINIK